MRVEELAPGLWRWTARGAAREQEASCYYVETAAATLLVDPLVPADEAERFWRALDRDVERRALRVTVLLTGAPHARSADAVAGRYGGEVRGPGGELAAGDRVAGDVVVLAGAPATPYWLPSHRAIAGGDLLAVEAGVLSIPAGREPALFRSWLDLPFERLLLADGPVEDGREALEAALSAQEETRRETARSQSSRTSFENGPTTSQ